MWMFIYIPNSFFFFFLIADGKILSLRSVQIQNNTQNNFNLIQCQPSNVYGKTVGSCVPMSMSNKQTNKLLLLLCLTMKFSIHSGNKNKTKNLVGRVLNFKFKNMKRRRGKKKKQPHNPHTTHEKHPQ